MNKILALTIALGLATTASAESMRVTTDADRPAVNGSAETFTGDVMVKPLFPADDHTTASGGQVDFSAGARSAWHTHPAGQTLIVVSGTGWVQEEGGAKREIKAGDVIWTPPGVKHWHGATDSQAMSHIAVTNVRDGKNVDWMEKVTDEEYLK